MYAKFNYWYNIANFSLVGRHMASMLNQNHLRCPGPRRCIPEPFRYFFKLQPSELCIINLLEVQQYMKKKEKHAYKCRFRSLFPPLLSMVLGPLFLIYVDDLPSVVQNLLGHSKVNLFADNVLLYHLISHQCIQVLLFPPYYVGMELCPMSVTSSSYS